MKLPNEAHTSCDWRIHEVAYDYRVEDVWALPTPGRREDFPHLVQVASDDATASSPVVRGLLAIRWKLGEVFGWDEAADGAATSSLRKRLPEDLREGPSGPDDGRFTPLYLTDREWAAEMVNKTMHGVMHVGWVPDETGDGYHGQLAVLVKPNGLFGRLYMAGITPFRYLLVYPLVIRSIERLWLERAEEREAT
ncbi:DUF2867 domain-containing protein (plasmid) [Streptomycetaceae bacterium NBC_01309]